jgi:two-component system response regulator BaeR
MRKILIVEDDRKIAAVLADYLRNAGFICEIFSDGREVVQRVQRDAPSAVLLDRMLPSGDGIEFCAALRKFSDVPIIMITARIELNDRLHGLGAGADDYVTKPFNPGEVVARVEAVVRRAEGRLTTGSAGRSYTIDESARRISWKGSDLDLSTSEFVILAALMNRPNRIFSREQLLDLLGERARSSADRAIDTHIKNIRRKILGVDPSAAVIASVYGSGYRFDA